MASNRPAESPSTGALETLRSITERISKLLQERTQSYLDVLRPALAPQRVLGQYMEHPNSKPVTGADKTWSRLSTVYRTTAQHIRGLPSGLDAPIPAIDPHIELYPWEYQYTPSAAGENKPITVTCPTKWVVSFRSPYTLSEFRQAIATGRADQPKQLQQFAVHAIVAGFMLRSLPKGDEFFNDLRLKLGEETAAHCGNLPVTTLASYVTSHLPGDDVVVSTTRLSGVARFMENVDVDSIKNLADPLRDQLLKLTA